MEFLKIIAPVLVILMPVFLLLLSALYKLYIHRIPDTPDKIRAFMELPVDIQFLTISLLIGYTISNTSVYLSGLGVFVILIILTFLVIIIWRKSVEHFNRGHFIRQALCTILNYILSIPLLVIMIFILKGDIK